jgi:hypothetical protein
MSNSKRIVIPVVVGSSPIVHPNKFNNLIKVICIICPSW